MLAACSGWAASSSIRLAQYHLVGGLEHQDGPPREKKRIMPIPLRLPISKGLLFCKRLALDKGMAQGFLASLVARQYFDFFPPFPNGEQKPYHAVMMIQLVPARSTPHNHQQKIESKPGVEWMLCTSNLIQRTIQY